MSQAGESGVSRWWFRSTANKALFSPGGGGGIGGGVPLDTHDIP